MARSRTIRPEFWNDEKLAKVSRDARLTYAGLWATSDDYGVTKGNACWLKSQIYPYDEDLKLSEFQKWISELENIRRIIAFSADDEKFYFIPKFSKHQKVDHPSKQRNPEPPEDLLSRNSREPLAKESPNRRDETETETETDTETETGKGTSVPLSSSDDSDPVNPTENPPGNGNGKGHPPDCPVLKIVELYHTRLPTFSKVQVLDKTTRSNIRNRWNEDPQRWSLEWWDEFFNYVGASDFLSGRKTDFKANFTWLVGPKNFAKVLNGAYDNNHSALGPKAQRNMAAAEAVKRMIDEGRL
jgi:hypothetical protein